METLTWLSLAQRRVTLGGEQFLLGDRGVWSGMSSISGTCPLACCLGSRTGLGGIRAG
jgi:hypothetical protein